MEVKQCKLNNKKFTTQTLAIHTSISAANLITRLLSKVAMANDIPFLTSKGIRNLGIDMDMMLHKHRQTVEGMTCIAIFGIDKDIMDKERTFRGGTKTIFRKSLVKKIGAASIEHTNNTDIMGEILYTN